MRSMTRRISTLVLLLIFPTVGSLSAQRAIAMSIVPPVSPSSDEIIFDDSDFLLECIAAVTPYSRVNLGVVGRPLITKSSSGQLICRIDLSVPDKHPPFVLDRAVIYRDEDARLMVDIAVGQQVDSLEKWYRK